jgi:hypothetical protein
VDYLNCSVQTMTCILLLSFSKNKGLIYCHDKKESLYYLVLLCSFYLDINFCKGFEHLPHLEKKCYGNKICLGGLVLQYFLGVLVTCKLSPKK